MSHITGLTDEQVATVAAIEQDSPHPIARAIVACCKPAQVGVADLKNIAGYGLSATVNGKTWLVGTTRLLEREGGGIPCPTGRCGRDNGRCGY